MKFSVQLKNKGEKTAKSRRCFDQVIQSTAHTNFYRYRQKAGSNVLEEDDRFFSKLYYFLRRRDDFIIHSDDPEIRKRIEHYLGG